MDAWLRRLRWGVVVFGLLLAVGMARGQEVPLPVDPAVQMGRLPNGVTYWVRAHATPAGKVSLWMHVAAGSLHEADGQEGLAHFLEHMAFNGTRHFPPGEAVRAFESLGLRFGRDQNAFTSFDQTTYLLTLPDTRPQTLERGLRFLADVAFGMLLLPEEIDKERGVILEEMRARKGVRQRLRDRLLAALLPGSRVARRLPIGRPESLARLQREDFLAYYRTWYHPSRITLLAVGDLPVADLVAAIHRHFAAWQPATPPPADPPVDIAPFAAPRAVVLTDPELTAAEVEILGLRPHRPRQTLADLRRSLVEELAVWMLHRRLQRRLHEGNTPFHSAAASQGAFLGLAAQVRVEAQAAPPRWAETLQALLREVQRVHAHGFTAPELEEAKNALRSDAEYAAQTEATRDARALLAAMLQALSLGERPRSAAQHLQLVRQLLPSIGLAEVKQAFAALLSPQHLAYLVSLPATPAAPKEREVLALVARTLAQPVAPWQPEAPPAALLSRVPAPGAIAAQTRFAPLDTTHVTFANQVRLHYRFMDVKKDQVTVLLTLGGGKIEEGAAERGLTEVASVALRQPATSRLSAAAIEAYLTDKKVQLHSDVTADALRLRLTATPEDLESGLQLVHLLLQDARLEPAAVARWRRRKHQALEALRLSLRGQAYQAALAVLSGNDPRLAPLTLEEVEARAADLAAAQAWLDRLLRQAPMEVAIVGDLPEARALALAATYLGSLPPRQPLAPPPAAQRQVAGFQGPVVRTVDVDTLTPRAHVLLLWRCADWQDVGGRRRIRLAAQILSRRLYQELRERQALTYAIGAYARPHKVYPRLSALYVAFTTDPHRVEEALRAAKEVVAAFVAEGPTDEEMATLRQQLRHSVPLMLKRPGFWAELLADLEYHGTRLEDVAGLLEALLAVDKAELVAELRRTVTPERAATIIATPRLTPAASAPPALKAGSPQ
ncbi:MAG: peptidase M16 [Candidatus Tectimicrobiota bacterium]|nr:MAG: peptidase M16 [Candidatus Tectomicrobia bacterium]